MRAAAVWNLLGPYDESIVFGGCLGQGFVALVAKLVHAVDSALFKKAAKEFEEEQDKLLF